ncbi:anaphase promoting complex subunit 4 KNAG_0H03190 [Huiozyma naganishii CBS 8797]|uniref:Anaphase-promoting complex subunit 4 n=1 Tax=Huiozyma naganishii (strain ATCC MYA-139 / BCRC 22969 / CBS 8797 / KCTC 17520 / NBRC 10181 / NCYC 3082 / Yp74L-3) TaxID=1071383 RepID=J7S8T7_HUIN7|nr:hypothetical protein KNAG_0H03190 [Kazachstania naganishii CBS 8797]CCK71734.1 hypothetical protein KNAG_0H03190 [Kazachstania naganishii CBS 8797]
MTEDALYARQFYTEVNNVLPLYVTRGTKQLVVNRDTDDSTIASTFIRDPSQVVSYQWDTIGGEIISVMFQDGSIRINDVMYDAKLVALLRTQRTGLDCVLWDRIRLPSRAQSMEWDPDIITQSLPRLVKFMGSDASPSMSPYLPTNHSWRFPNSGAAGGILDVHFLHQKLGDTLVALLNGEYQLQLTGPHQEDQSELRKIIARTDSKRHVYNCYYKTGPVRQVDLTGFVEDKDTIKLLERFLLFQDYLGYFLAHLEPIQTECVEPYQEFIERLCEDAFGKEKLQESLTDHFLVGSMDEELRDWLVYSLGERNLEEWKSLMNTAYRRTSQVVLMCLVPVSERLIILCEQLQALVLTAQLSEGMVGDSLEISEFTDLLENCQELLQLVLQTVKQLAKDIKDIKVFLLWLENVLKTTINKDYPPNFNVSECGKFGFLFTSGLALTLEPAKKTVTFFDESRRIVRECGDLLLQVDNLYVRDLLLSKVIVGDPIPLLNSYYIEHFVTLLDIAQVAAHPAYLIYLCRNMSNRSEVLLGAIDCQSNKVATDIKLPYNHAEMDIEGVRIMGDASQIAPESHQTTKITLPIIVQYKSGDITLRTHESHYCKLDCQLILHRESVSVTIARLK